MIYNANEVPAPHHFAPGSADRIADRADVIFNDIVANNERIRAILAECAAKLAACDMAGVSMVPGYDLDDITKAIEELMPQTDDKAMVAYANDYAYDRAQDGR